MNQTTEIETFWNGMQRYYLEGGEIAVIVGSRNVSRPSFEFWASTIVTTANTAPDPRYTYLMIEVASPIVAFTPFSRVLVNEMLNQTDPNRTYFVAFLVRDNVFNQLLVVFINTVLRRSEATNHFIYDMFTERQKALTWLRQKMTERVDKN